MPSSFFTSLGDSQTIDSTPVKRNIASLINVSDENESYAFEYNSLTDTFEVVDSNGQQVGTIEIDSSNSTLVDYVIPSQDQQGPGFRSSELFNGNSEVNIIFTLVIEGEEIDEVIIPVQHNGLG